MLEHPEVLDELAYQAYCRLEDHPELLPAGAPALKHYSPAGEKRKRGKREPVPAMDAIPVRILRERGKRPSGRLLAALLARREEGAVTLFRRLEAAFAALLKGLRKEKKTPFP